MDEFDQPPPDARQCLRRGAVDASSMLRCFCCEKHLRDTDAIPVPSLNVVMCAECEKTAHDNQNGFSKPDYAKAWTRSGKGKDCQVRVRW